MELKPGYKQTEVGLIPEDWDVKRLGEVARFRTGPFGSALHKEDYTDNGIPIVNPMHIVDAAIVPTYEMTITAQRATELADFRLRQGDIVIGRRGEMGRCAVVAAAQDGWLCGTGSMIIRANQGYSAEFLQLILSSKPVITSIENASVGSTMINLNQGVLNGLKVALPSNIEGQQAIATSIKAVGSQVEALQSLITKKRQLKQAAMQELLTGKRRLPGFAGKWETVAISQVAEKITGFWGRTEPGSEAMHSTSVIRAGDISEDGRLIGAARRYLSHHESSLAGCRTGDTVMTASGNGLGKSWTCDQDGVYSASNFVRIIRPQRGKADGYFVGFALKSRRARSKLVEHTATSAYPNLKPSFFNLIR
ncbi:restriction endonuclease subunit S [Synechococcus sp. CCY9202]|uniref:restriction endonuclease subunit S n=1 Tax=Synechococcus sp. CCY9202 TaxID=174698 RepID=UPI002B1EAECB|nr:restriction endonuclease subunit S [Synechococcus sp. CCY9202]MEA5422025.1 restriction endonuclease subunit S [Synechococcus sp. CCY9202]